ncbi:MAG: 2-C-methyl-D-erythritol 4-phosphate cytidylyltransferase [Patescibacteria group bacterium]|nr:2-C-methyl-D-erythritol 4-phosphate cytidylyltransferase [Patescibacteria group bacterium]
MTTLKRKKNIAILVGAGEGKRMGGKDKPFLVLDNKPLLVHSILPFEESKLCDEIILVVRKNRVSDCKKIVQESKFKKVKKIISGGLTRQDSVYRGLNEIKKAGVVLVHDIARPLISKNVIENCIKSTEKSGATVPVIPVKDTVKQGKRIIKRTVNRSELRLAQTPQVFKYEILREAYKSAKKNKFEGTDDASLVEELGHKIKMIAGQAENIKITVPDDLIIAESLIKNRDSNAIEVKAYAKINLDFKILGKFSDGYHRIKSVFQAVDLYDSLTISKSKKFRLTGSLVCATNLNLVTQAKNKLEKYTKRKLPCNIHLIKAIPVSSGLGGGSSDASAVIIGLNKLYDLGLSLKELAEVALEVGCDLPFFISNSGKALVTGKGEGIQFLDTKIPKVYILARPHKRVSTSQMYNDYDRTKKSFFKLVEEMCPVITETCHYFSKTANKCGLSGSGPTLFAEFDSYPQAIKAMDNFNIEKFDGDLFICQSVAKTYDLRR